MDDLHGHRSPPWPDDEGLPPEPPPGRAGQIVVRSVQVGERLLFVALVVLLFGVAFLALAQTTYGLVRPPPLQASAETITRALNGVLFVVIVIEVLRTIVGRFQGQGLRLQPFLVIAIVSTVRHILTVAARLSLEGERNGKALIIELLATAGVVLVLAVALVLLRRWGQFSDR